MAGHSKFKNIMHRKGRQDAVRSKLFSKLSRESLEKSLERAESARPLRCMMFLNLECPAMVRRTVVKHVKGCF